MVNTNYHISVEQPKHILILLLRLTDIRVNLNKDNILRNIYTFSNGNIIILEKSTPRYYRRYMAANTLQPTS